MHCCFLRRQNLLPRNRRLVRAFWSRVCNTEHFTVICISLYKFASFNHERHAGNYILAFEHFHSPDSSHRSNQHLRQSRDNSYTRSGVKDLNITQLLLALRSSALLFFGGRGLIFANFPRNKSVLSRLCCVQNVVAKLVRHCAYCSF